MISMANDENMGAKIVSFNGFLPAGTKQLALPEPMLTYH